jgi:hypothetical protein
MHSQTYRRRIYTTIQEKSFLNIGLLKHGFWVMDSCRLKETLKSLSFNVGSCTLEWWPLDLLKNSRCCRNHLTSTLFHCCKSWSPLTSSAQRLDLVCSQR